MIRFIKVLCILLMSISIQAQTVIAEENPHRADVLVYIENNPHRADILVYRVSRQSRTNGDGTMWFISDKFRHDAVKVYFVNNRHRSDINVHFVSNRHRAGWQNNNVNDQIKKLLKK